ncbi:bifunctional adenosylcobinamide kinase/adenosylcobinamide-phosphate guanylyltransferase [Halocynthiibacter styelae]|uniref:Bifunctional adenosylcobalamin biosynthesis protein n=1 Tax=Halocynthiibacter styelae TaxID=2761955 RepID=A0A8J7J6W6_9RHOB|nr:bifunctional adenosylcobinamide kinase/adenosylcobinamide-phosphate guanylyltransferase [Paenihalocynthiibacter styelae]MBI1494625.1 bifunctional adenosylcobinamide kinase/adenosylcobinamide-phosphate guanylyltransferase [Paenihalocynthiibacter styelae]
MTTEFTHLPHLTFVLGGAASGKSRFAEGLAEAWSDKHLYIATAQAFDDEMQVKITRHQDRRGTGWHTIEAPLDVPSALTQVQAGEIVLFDCASLWLSNHMFAENEIEAETDKLVRALQNCPAPVIIVSNEVGQGVVPENALARRFRQLQGEVNQALAATSDTVVFVTAGLPQILKGQLP